MDKMYWVLSKKHRFDAKSFYGLYFLLFFYFEIVSVGLYMEIIGGFSFERNLNMKVPRKVV